MPLNIDFVQVLIHMLNLVVLVGGLTLLLFKPITKFMGERKEYYENLEKETAQKVEEAERAKAEYEKKMASVKEEMAELRIQQERQMAGSANAYLQKAQAKADKIIADAENIARERKAHILDSAQSDFSEMVLEAAKKLISDTSTPERDRELYDAFIRSTKGSEEGERP